MEWEATPAQVGQALGSSTALNLGKAGLSLPLVTRGGGRGLQPGKLVLCFCVLSSLSVQLPYLFSVSIHSIFPRRYGRNLWLWHYTKQEIAFYGVLLSLVPLWSWCTSKLNVCLWTSDAFSRDPDILVTDLTLDKEVRNKRKGKKETAQSSPLSSSWFCYGRRLTCMHLGKANRWSKFYSIRYPFWGLQFRRTMFLLKEGIIFGRQRSGRGEFLARERIAQGTSEQTYVGRQWHGLAG